MKKILFLYLILVMHLFTNAQETTVLPSKKLKSIYFEAGGRAIYGSFNYEQTLKNYKNGYLTGSVGFSLIPISWFMNWAVPVNVKYVFGTKKHHLEVGLGATFHSNNYKIGSTTYERWLYLTPSIGYRFQKPTNGLFFTANFIPTVGVFEYWNPNNRNVNDGKISFFNEDTAFFPTAILPWAGFSIGYSFK
jgi:hypothetical protein